MSIRFARSATKHRIAKSRSRHVIEQAAGWFEVSAPKRPSTDVRKRLVFLGDDPDGIALEVVAVELGAGELLVIHAMHLRDKYRDQYLETKTWEQ